jgi:hypothetical protein
MTATRKPRRAREAEPERRHPTERQMDAALAAFDKSKLRHQIVAIGSQVAVRILPELLLPETAVIATGWRFDPASKPELIGESVGVKYFPDEPSARQWREREIIKEAVTAALRAKP